MKLKELFDFFNAKSKGFEDYSHGDVAFVTNGFKNNGIVGYVTPKKGDRVFDFEGICVSAFCEATVQKPPFLPRGNGGSGLLVLKPKKHKSFEDLLKIAAYINRVHMWRFSYGRMVNRQRVESLDINISSTISIRNNISKLLPSPHKVSSSKCFMSFKLFNITELFDLERGQFHALDRLSEGKYPTVSRVADDNGVVGFYNKPRKAKVYPRGTVTVATTTGDAFVQLDDFIATDNIVILLPKIKLCLEELYFIAAMINREKWRVSYGRQCYKTIFAKTNIFLPIDSDSGNINHGLIKSLTSKMYNFGRIKAYIKN